MTPKLFRKKPVTIEAWQVNSLDYDEMCAIVAWCKGTAVGAEELDGSYVMTIDTLEGTMHVAPGDWVIRGVRGEFYPCKPEIFEATYEPVV